jgi:hypothetical protein
LLQKFSWLYPLDLGVLHSTDCGYDLAINIYLELIMKKYMLLFLAFPVFAQDWSLVENLAPSAAEKSDFGVGMVFAGDKLVVGWPRTFGDGLTANTAPNSCGEVITYEKVAGQFVPIATLSATDLTGTCIEGDGFGYGLAYDDGLLAIGMPAGVRAGTGRPGGGTDADSRVFLTRFEGDNWVLEDTLVTDDLGAGQGIGFQMVLQDNVLLVGGHEYKTLFGFSFPAVNGVYVFENDGSGFTQRQKLQENFNLYGQDFDYENGQIVVGAWGEQALTQPGRVYVYDKQGSSWQLSQTINDTRNSNLGNQIEIDGDLMAVGAVQAGGSGSVTLYKNNNGQWQEQQFIQASDAQLNDQFAITVRIHDNDLIVGATGGTDPGTTTGAAVGAVYHFVKQADGVFVEQQKIESFEPNEGNDQFGGNLIFNDTDLLVNETSGGTLSEGTTEFLHYSRSGTGNPDPETFAVNNQTSGVWSVDGATGQSISLQIMPDDRVLLYGNANNNGDSFWLVGIGSYSENNIDFENLYTTSGAQFGAAFNSADVVNTNLGSAMISLSACDAGSLLYDLNGLGTGEVGLSKAIEIPGNECGNSTKVLANGVSGSWFDPARSGEGYTVYLTEQSGAQQAEVTWYTYDQNGQQLALQGVGTVSGQTVTVEALQSIQGADFLSGSSSTTDLGSLTMIWEACRTAEVSYDLSPANLGSGSMQLVQLSNLDNTDCGTLNKDK